MIFWSIYSSYNIYTGLTTAPQVFKIENTEIESTSSNEIKPVVQTKNPQELQGQMEDIIASQIGDQMKSMIPSDYLPKILNLVIWSLFAGLLIFAGSQISGIGTKLIK